MRRWLANLWHAIGARWVHDNDLCPLCAQYLWDDGHAPEYSQLGLRVHARCLTPTDENSEPYR